MNVRIANRRYEDVLADNNLPQATEVAAAVYDAWTAKGARVEQLAERYMDGSVDSLAVLFKGNLRGGDAVPTEEIPQQQRQFQPAKAEIAGAGAAPVDVRNCKELSYGDFVSSYMAPNIPVLIEGITDDWVAARDWVCPDGTVDIDFMDEHFGKSVVTTVDTSRQSEGCSHRRRGTLSEYLVWWRSRDTASAKAPCLLPCHSQQHQGNGGSVRATCDLCGGAQHAVEVDAHPAVLYLKDWHFRSDHPEYQAYSTPQWFRDDWLNRFFDERQAQRHVAPAGQQPSSGCSDPDGVASQCSSWQLDGNPLAESDYRFVYLGVKGTWTGLHADVLRSYSWSANVAGAKHWQLLPPQYTHLLYDRFGRDVAPSFDAGDCGGRFPHLEEARRHVVHVRQGTGSALFVPSGWHHTVTNLEDTLSINHNWINAFNLHWGLQLLQREHSAAAAAIDDCRSSCDAAEFEALVQRNMAANAGLNFAGLSDLLCTIAAGELQAVRDLESTAQPHSIAETAEAPSDVRCGHPSSGTQRQLAVLQHRFNLRRVKFVLEALIDHQWLALDGEPVLNPGVSEMLHTIRQIEL